MNSLLIGPADNVSTYYNCWFLQSVGLSHRNDWTFVPITELLPFRHGQQRNIRCSHCRSGINITQPFLQLHIINKMTPAGLMLLRVAPLLTSTSHLTYTISEDLYLRPFGSLRPDLRSEANRLIPAYRDRWFPRSLVVIFTLYPLGIAAAVANLVVEGSRLDISGTSGTNHRIAGYLYAAGAFFAALHFAFGPRDLSILKRISEKDKDNEAAMADWVRMNLVRGLIADLPSWVCYFAGFMLAVS